VNHIAVKEAVFPFARFPGVDIVLGPEMRSTGEVMGIDVSFERAFAKSQIAGGSLLPESGTVFISVKDRDKASILEAAQHLKDMNFKIIATGGTANFLQAQGISATRINKVLEGRPHIVDAMKNGEIDLVLNTTEGAHSQADSYTLRRTALIQKIPYYTTVSGAKAAILAIKIGRSGALEVRSLQTYTE